MLAEPGQEASGQAHATQTTLARKRVSQIDDPGRG
jgi:hypothetical protein